MLTLEEFIGKYNGVAQVGDTPENTGECVGLIEVWFDNLGLPHDWGNAKDLLSNADTNAFDVILNAPANMPIPGDVIVWDSSWGNGAGHTGLIVQADVSTFSALEQNNPTGSACHIVSHPNYNGVLGWLRQKAATVQVPSTTFQDIVGKATKYDAIAAAGFPSIDDILKRINDLTNEKTGLIQDVLTAKQQASDQAALAKQAHDEDITAVQQSLDAQHALAPLQQFRTMVLEQLALPGSSSDADVHTSIEGLKRPNDEAAKVYVKNMEAAMAGATSKGPVKPQPTKLEQFIAFLVARLQQVREVTSHG